MKKFIVFCMALLMFGIGSTRTINSADAAFSKDDVVRARFARKKEQLAEVVSKKVAQVEQSIKTKLKEQLEKKEQQKKEEEQKQAAEAEKKGTAEKETAQQAEQSKVPQEAIAEQPTQQEAVNDQGAEAVSGASGNWQERKQKGREWGERLRDPNLTPEERQGIIQEKKNYYHKNH